MIDCQELAAALWADLEGSLPGELTTALETHLAECPSCTALRNTYRATVDLARALRPATLPEDVDRRFRERIEARREREKAEASSEGEIHARDGRATRDRNRHRKAAEDSPRSTAEATGGDRPSPGPAPDSTEGLGKTPEETPSAGASGRPGPEVEASGSTTPGGRDTRDPGS